MTMLQQALMIKEIPYMRVLLGILSLILFSGCWAPEEPPYSPEQALQTFQLPPGFRIELVAAEPEITDPVDIAFDADGRLYVAEMPDYPAQGDEPPKSRIKLLKDLDGDGRYETSTVFAEDLPFVNGVMVWKEGILVTRAPDIIYFEDTDGDGRADVRRVVLTGFAATNPQLRMNHLEYGIDNWIYGAYPRTGGTRRHPQFADRGDPLTFPNDPEQDAVDISPGTDFRFRPGEYRVEPAGGESQFGNAFDAAGNRFVVWNDKHIRHHVIPYRYIARNPYLSVSSVMASIPDHGDAATLYPITENPLHLKESQIGHFTAACGTAIYTGGKFPEEYQGNAFVCAPVHNVVHSDVLRSSGATFTASRPREEKEFLSSTDSWFRPVTAVVGPDGALYIADFYRKIVEHPAFVPQADSEGLYTYAGRLTEADFLEGQDKGRIYRIVPENFKGYGKPSMSEASAEELVERLSHPNRWWRITAQRLLVHQKDQSAIPFLIEMAGQSSSAQGRIHALWTLDGVGSLDIELVLDALDDESPLVRKQAIRLAEKRLHHPDIRARLVEMADDPDEKVQFQLALTLGSLPPDESFDALKQIAFRHIEDTWFQKAVLTGASENALQWYRAVGQYQDFAAIEVDGKAQFLRRVASIIGARQNEDEIAYLLTDIAREDEKTSQEESASLKGLAEGLRQGASPAVELSSAGQEQLLELIAPSSGLREMTLDVAAQVKLRNTNQLRTALQQASETAFDEDAASKARIDAIRILGLDPANTTVSSLKQLLAPQHPGGIRIAAARALMNTGGAGVISFVLEEWETYPVRLRKVVERELMADADRIFALLDAVEEGKIVPTQVSLGRRRVLMLRYPNEKIRNRAKSLFADLQANNNREEVVIEYRQAIQMDGSSEEGRAIFEEQCTICHKAEGAGFEVGPGLASAAGHTQISLLTQILNPSSNIVPGYELYIVETAGGETFSGVMVSESASSILLRSAGGVERSVLRSNIEALHPSQSSLMPEGLESRISVEEMADLLSYLKSLG